MVLVPSWDGPGQLQMYLKMVSYMDSLEGCEGGRVSAESNRPSNVQTAKLLNPPKLQQYLSRGKEQILQG